MKGPLERQVTKKKRFFLISKVSVCLINLYIFESYNWVNNGNWYQIFIHIRE
jgi:hypothetical protein